jgi:hypothetical protein
MFFLQYSIHSVVDIVNLELPAVSRYEHGMTQALIGIKIVLESELNRYNVNQRRLKFSRNVYFDDRK